MRPLKALTALCALALLAACDLMSGPPPFAYGTIRLLRGRDADERQTLVLRIELENRGDTDLSGFALRFLLFAEDGKPVPALPNSQVKAAGSCRIPPGQSGVIDVRLEQYFYHTIPDGLSVEAFSFSRLDFADGGSWQDIGRFWQYPEPLVLEDE